MAIALREERWRQHGALAKRFRRNQQLIADRISSTLLGERSVRMGLGAFWYLGDFGIGVHLGMRAHVGAPLRMMNF